MVALDIRLDCLFRIFRQRAFYKIDRQRQPAFSSIQDFDDPVVNCALSAIGLAGRKNIPQVKPEF
jgi:hypothetical protein